MIIVPQGIGRPEKRERNRETASGWGSQSTYDIYQLSKLCTDDIYQLSKLCTDVSVGL